MKFEDLIKRRRTARDDAGTAPRCPSVTAMRLLLIRHGETGSNAHMEATIKELIKEKGEGNYTREPRTSRSSICLPALPPRRAAAAEAALLPRPFAARSQRRS